MTGLTVLVTGANGKIGRRLVPLLLKRGHSVIASAREAHGADGCTPIAGDLAAPTVRQAAMSALVRQGAERCALIHLAAFADAAAVRLQCAQAFASNVQLTQQLLETAVEFKVPRFLLASTGLVYSAASASPIVEDAPLAPRSYYAATKLAAEALVQGYAAEGCLRGEIFRLSNVYGPDSPENTVSGRILAQLRRREAIQVATREPVRDFIYVDDAASAICAHLENSGTQACRVTNISSGRGVSIGELADTANAIYLGQQAPEPGQASDTADRFVLCNDLLRGGFGWNAQFTLIDGLRACLREQSAT